jgi:hypothetical protein
MIDRFMPSVCSCHSGKALLSMEGLRELGGTGAPDQREVHGGEDERDKVWRQAIRISYNFGNALHFSKGVSHEGNMREAA